MNTLRIGLAQCCQTSDFEENKAAIFTFLEKAAEAGVQILCFPETQTVGYRVDITPTKAPVPVLELQEMHQSVARFCGEHGMACILGTEVPSGDGKPFNSALVISEKGEILGARHKAKLTPLDAIAYSPGDGTTDTWELFGVTVGVVICFEGFRFAETTRACVAQGAQLVFHPQNNTTRPNDWKVPVHHAMIATRAAENTIWFASCNCCYPEHQNCQSRVIAPTGEVFAECEMKQEELLVSDIDIDLATRAMFEFDTKGCAEMLFADTVRPEEYESNRTEK